MSTFQSPAFENTVTSLAIRASFLYASGGSGALPQTKVT
jgi:hypothetical protein